MFFLVAVVFVEHKKFACFDLMAAKAPSTIPKGTLNTSMTLNDKLSQGDYEAVTANLC